MDGERVLRERRPMRQWMMRITAYSERLLEDAKELDWPVSTLEQQRNWIGRSEGADVVFAVKGKSEKIRVFTTRPDTLFGATYMVLAPEHPLVDEIAIPEQQEEILIIENKQRSRANWNAGQKKKRPASLPAGMRQSDDRKRNSNLDSRLCI